MKETGNIWNTKLALMTLLPTLCVRENVACLDELTKQIVLRIRKTHPVKQSDTR